jgi:2-methylisocitrate lyase-like PEP mutase family enzyme
VSDVITQAEKAKQFLALHKPGEPLLMANPWDLGSARVLASLGFRALATTSSGAAMSLGRTDGALSRAEALEHARGLAGFTDLPVSADLEQGFADTPQGVATTIELAMDAGLAGCSIEDYSGSPANSLYDIGLAAERITAAAEVAHLGEIPFVLTARAENHIRGNPDLADTIARLQAYQEAGADVLYAPGLTDLADIRQVIASVDRPVNVLALPASPPVAELAEAGVSRISVGGSFFNVAYAALAAAATELRDQGTYTYLSTPALPTLRAAFTP